MESEINLQIILLKPTPDVDFGLQKGAGSNYKTVQKQRSKSQDLIFNFSVKIKGDRTKDILPKFAGSFVQGPAANKFIYIDIGTCAGQRDCIWSRRLKIPLTSITWKDIDFLVDNPNSIMETVVPGTGKDGSPSCATVKPFNGWHIKVCKQELLPPNKSFCFTHTTNPNIIFKETNSSTRQMNLLFLF